MCSESPARCAEKCPYPKNKTTHPDIRNERRVNDIDTGVSALKLLLSYQSK